MEDGVINSIQFTDRILFLRHTYWDLFLELNVGFPIPIFICNNPVFSFAGKIIAGDRDACIYKRRLVPLVSKYNYPLLKHITQQPSFWSPNADTLGEASVLIASANPP